jgi:signal transduction histidine kinase
LRRLIESLVAKHFGDPATSEYLVTIDGGGKRSPFAYDSGSARVDSTSSEAAADLFDLRLDMMDRVAAVPGAPPITQHVAITVVRRNRAAGSSASATDPSAWQIRVRHRAQSLDAIVAQSRRRNLAVGLGVLGLLGASVVLIAAAGQRQQRLARQQMEFVAAVSHELRTPLAVICSAAENLADGVVADGAQVKRYGSLIQSEGRRLRDMVERVLEFSGITSARPVRRARSVDCGAVVASAVEGASRDAHDRGITVAVHAHGTVPLVNGDADALGSALVNIIGNAVKYSPPGSTIDVSLARHHDFVRVSVVDRGLGIDDDDLPHIFKPFYRGRRATEAQVRGTGVGLSVVRHVIDAHHGLIHVESRPGEGTTFVVDLPVAGEIDPTPGAAAESVSHSFEAANERP